MNNMTKAAVGVGAAAALASGIFYSTREPARDVGVLQFAEQVGKTHVAKTKSGKQVRIVMGGVAGVKEEDTEFGKAFVLPVGPDGETPIPEDALCNIVFEADIVKKDGRLKPDIKGLDNLLNAGAFPVLVRTDDDDVGIWNCLFKGNNCISAAELPGYIGSDINQFVNHPKRKFLLKTYAKPGAKDKKGNAKGQVDIDDVDADPLAEVVFPHSWAGRTDLAMGVYQAGAVTSAVEKERIEREKAEKEKGKK